MRKLKITCEQQISEADIKMEMSQFGLNSEDEYVGFLKAILMEQMGATGLKGSETPKIEIEIIGDKIDKIDKEVTC